MIVLNFEPQNNKKSKYAKQKCGNKTLQFWKIEILVVAVILNLSAYVKVLTLSYYISTTIN